jgi:hypothetical protein
MEITGLLAFYGTIVSTAALVWNILRDSRDRPKIKLEAMIGKLYPDHTERDYLVLTMTNIGRRPVQIKGWYGLRKKRKTDERGILVVTQGLPRILNEAESHHEFCTSLSILNDDLQTLYVSDSADRKWKLSKKQLRQLVEQQSEISQKGTKPAGT